MTARRLGALVAVAAFGAALATAGPHLSARAAAAGPDAQAWWYAGYIGQNTPKPPPPPGVDPTDLLVQGTKGDQSLPSGSSLPAPVPAPPPPPPNPFVDLGTKGSATAIAALRFTIPAGSSVARLTLHYHGSPPPTGPQVAACRIPGGTFTAEQEGPFADVPAYDCTVPSIGSIGSVGPDGTSLVFSDIGALAKGSILAVALVPIYPDQEVFAQPGADALSFRAAPPAFDSGAGGGPLPGAAVPSGGGDTTAPADGGSGGGGGGAGQALPPGGSTPADASGAATSSGPPGPTAASAVPSTPNRHPAPAAAAPRLDDTRARVAAAIALLAALGGFAALLLDRSRLRLLLGGRPTLTPDDGARQTIGGLGRFARPRSGHPHHL